MLNNCFYMEKITPIKRKVNLIIIISLIVGLGIRIVYFAYNQNTELITTTQNNLHQQSDLLYQSVKNAILTGNAPNAVSLFTDIRDINPAYEIMLFRENGVQAFSDNSTVSMVNSNINKKIFSLRKTNPTDVVVIKGNTHFSRTVAMRKTSAFEAKNGNRDYFTIYKPLLNLPKCAVCHGSDHTVRGVIKISSDITPILRKRE